MLYFENMKMLAVRLTRVAFTLSTEFYKKKSINVLFYRRAILR